MLHDSALPTWPRWPPDWPEIHDSVGRVLRDGQWGRYHAEVTDQLASQIASQFCTSHVHLCASGTAATELALRAAGLQPGDEVLLSAFDFPGNRRTVELLQLRPVLVDCCANSVDVDVQALMQAASGTTRAAIVSHLYGSMLDLEKLRQWADAKEILLIEDACHCPGADAAGRPAGTWGHVGILSFGGSKTLTSGNGGALLTDDPRLAQRAKVISHRPSDCTPLSALQAAALLPQLQRLESMAQQRRRRAAALSDWLAQRAADGWLAAIAPQAKPQSDYFKFAFSAPTPRARNRAAAAAEKLGIPLRAGYRSAGGVSARRCRRPDRLPEADRLGQCLLTLDHPLLLADEKNFTALLHCLQNLLCDATED